MCVLCHFANVLQCDSGNMCRRRELTKVASRDDKDAKKNESDTKRNDPEQDFANGYFDKSSFSQHN